MTREIREHVTIEQEGLLVIRNPAFSVGTRAEVIVLVESPDLDDRPLVSFIGTGKGCFADADEVDAFLRGNFSEP